MKLKPFENEITREAAVVMAVQNIGVASYEEIKAKLEGCGLKSTLKQIEKCCENLQRRQIFSVDLKDLQNKRFAMRRIGVSVPEIGQIRAIVDAKNEDSAEVRALIEELEASKKNAKIAPNNYYDVDVEFQTSGNVFGFMPDGNGIANKHYRDEDGGIVFFRKHFRAWLREGLQIANQFENTIQKLFFFNGTCDTNGHTCTIKTAFITNVDKTHKGAGRGAVQREALPEGSIIRTKFRVPGSKFTPEQFRKLLELTGESSAFGGAHKMSNAQMTVEKFTVSDKVWNYS